MAQETLTWREEAVLRMLSQGKTTKEISDVFGVTTGQIQLNISKCMKKLKAKDRKAAVKKAKELKLI